MRNVDAIQSKVLVLTKAKALPVALWAHSARLAECVLVRFAAARVGAMVRVRTAVRATAMFGHLRRLLLLLELLVTLANALERVDCLEQFGRKVDSINRRRHNRTAWSQNGIIQYGNIIVNFNAVRVLLLCRAIWASCARCNVATRISCCDLNQHRSKSPT